MFVWGFLVWAVLPVHKDAIHVLPNEDAVVAALKQSNAGPGVYFFPAMPPSDATAEVRQAYEEKYRVGPVGMLSYNPAGLDPMMAKQFIYGFVIAFLSAALVAWFLTRSTAYAGTYVNRVAYCGMFGVFLTVASHLVTWNWLAEPNDWTVAWIIDSVAGWVVVGLVIAAIIKPKPAAPANA